MFRRGSDRIIRFCHASYDPGFQVSLATTAFSGAGVSLICVFAAVISIIKVIRLEAAIVFKG